MAEKNLKLMGAEIPNLYRDVFPYSGFPRVKFDSTVVPIDIPENLWIKDTTCRDGQQARPLYTPEQPGRVLIRLLEKGVPVCDPGLYLLKRNI